MTKLEELKAAYIAAACAVADATTEAAYARAADAAGDRDTAWAAYQVELKKAQGVNPDG